MAPSGGIGARTRPARQWPSQSGWREAPMASLQSGQGPTVRNTIAVPVGALDADCRAWREGPQSRGRWSTPRRARAAGAAQEARCMSGRSIAFRRPNFDHRLPSVIITGGRSFSEMGGIGAAVTARDVPNLYFFLPCFRNRELSSSTNQPSFPAAGRWRHVTPGKGCVFTRASEIPNPLSLPLSLSLSSYPSSALFLFLSPFSH